MRIGWIVTEANPIAPSAVEAAARAAGHAAEFYRLADAAVPPGAVAHDLGYAAWRPSAAARLARALGRAVGPYSTLSRRLAELGPDLLVLPAPPEDPALVSALLRSGIPLLSACPDGGRLRAQLGRRAAGLVVEAPWAAREVASALARTPESVPVVPRALAEAWWGPKDELRCAQLREDHRIPERYVLCLGPIGVARNHARSVQALWAIDRDRHETPTFVYAGAFEDPPGDILGWAREWRIEAHVRVIPGATEADQAALADGAAVVLVPDTRAPSASPLLGALTRRAPLAASRLPAFTDLLGSRFPSFAPEDPEEMALAVWNAWSDARLREALAAAAAEIAPRRMASDAAADWIAACERCHAEAWRAARWRAA